ncbi:MAG: hypothetical protein WC966_04505 [Bradymonadales bacterium]|jgi:Tfp pilus assembly protein PilO
MDMEKLQNWIKESRIGQSWVVLLAIVVFVLALIFTGVRSYTSSISDKKRQIDEYRDALEYLENNQADYVRNKAAKESMRERLLNADTKIVSKLTSLASGLGFDVSVTPKDPLKTADDSGAESQEISITVRNVEYTKLLEYLIEIDKLHTPIFLRKILFTRTGNNATSDTQMAAEITLISYRLKEENAQ